MKIMVFDVPAESGGALTVLHEFYNEFKKDISNEYILVVSKPKLKETQNTKVLRFPWIKKSWIHRIFFDQFIAPRLIKKFAVDKVISLQNIMISHSKVYQTVYVHNALPFSDYKFSIFRNKFLWFYQNIIGKRILSSIKNSDQVIVQTEWMKSNCIRKLNIDEKKIIVMPPKVSSKAKGMFDCTNTSLSTFFYPANGAVFKNHNIIIDACINLKDKGIYDYKVIFTLNGNENKHIHELFVKVKSLELPIYFVGKLSHETVFEMYSKSVLIFPSSIETVGLPLLEAKIHNSPIITYKQPFSEEILAGYERVDFFVDLDSTVISDLMKKMINRRLDYY
ncbi:glycosyltransferase [Neobacillus niacini]|uniref:glycosyltransferase n=1 Tax=Neobacillus niacini TaxID=86668 RepID=UPI003982E0D8